ncbi:DUF4190 domain-containing protein [Isoptericola sp. b408]|uniref:DUF4190 domain-containing protein n=1 Tax=Isoptericola sp. b408 TaxID=3064653 RepID=UPI0027133B72|nr:DUF4190 domain-containing protein [Isoptericola sp. b408]MDO8150362.1 DUF4190 domain-containing protein [Isoptericola sp. b408]
MTNPPQDPYAPPTTTAPDASAPPTESEPSTPDAPTTVLPDTADVPAQPYGVPPTRPGTDGLAIAALVTGILQMTIIPLGLGIAALVRIRTSGRSGKGFAIAGIVLGALSTVAWAAIILLFSALFTNDDFQEAFAEGFEEGYEESTGTDLGLEDSAGTDPGLAEASSTEITVGDCFEDPPLEAVDCTSPHHSEVFGVQELAGEEFPGEQQVIKETEEFCLSAFTEYVGTDYMDSSLDFFYYYPTEEMSTSGDREVFCEAVTMDGSPLEGTVAGSGI